RPKPCITVQPIREENFFNGTKIIRYQKALKEFSANETAGKHCYSREELLAETCGVTGCARNEAETVLHQLFAFQPDLTYNRYGAICKQERMPVFSGFCGTVSIPYEMLKKDLPEEWYISLQIPDALIDRMIWSCRKAGQTICHPCSSLFAERILQLYKKRRGDFIRKNTFRALKFLWLEYGSIGFPEERIRKTVIRYQRETE
ncbi:MAG: hypothetical protein J5858_06555, partial [Lentisphaeria bacterium]|nr:hypothetical protein [Lentisphaeria bacterium]